MGKLIYKSGDLFTSDAPAIGQGVNCKGAMGAGIALTFQNKYPDMYQEYKRQCRDNILEPGGLMVWSMPGEQVVYNLASQNYPGPDAQVGWIGGAMKNALTHADANGIDRIAIPMIGAGIGGLDWEPVEAILRGCASQHNADIEIWVYDK